MTLYFSHKANLNAGLITMIFVVQSVYVAAIESRFYNRDLMTYHKIGMVLLILGVLLLAISGRSIILDIDRNKHYRYNFRIAVPILIGFITPMWYAAQYFWIKN